MLRIAFDVGGVLSKYPDVFRPLFHALVESPQVEVFIISDIKPRQKVLDLCRMNNFVPGDREGVGQRRIHVANYDSHGEHCKAILCEELKIDILIDDHIGYLADVNMPKVRLLVMPDPTKDYYHPTWKTDGSEGNFGRVLSSRAAAGTGFLAQPPLPDLKSES